MEFLPSSGCVNTTIWMHHKDSDKTYRRELYKNATSYIEQIPEATPHETTAVRPLTSLSKTFQDEQDIRDTAEETRMNS